MSLVWLNMTQEELDRAYNQADYAPNREQILARYSKNSELMRSRIGEPERLRYGVPEIEGIDLFRTHGRVAPAVIVVHGGAWRSGSAKQYAYLSEIFINAGAHCLIPDFDWVQDRAGDLMPIADQVGRSIAWICTHADELKIDSKRIFLCAHSSGSHLAASVLTGYKDRIAGLADHSIKAALLCSGMYDLKPVRMSARSNYVAFTDESEHLLSPMRHLDNLTTPLILAHGTLETPEFQRQTADFAAAIEKHGMLIEAIVAEYCNHFEILETLANPYGLLGRAALRMIEQT
ncbi:MAG: alpha/beta hydrolase [Rhodospirillaceae bacterium]